MYNPGDILIVPFPFSDLSAVKQRPVLVLSKREYNLSSEDIIVCGITSNIKNESHSVLIDNTCLETGVIPSKSRIKVNKIFTISRQIIKKKVARIDKQTFDKVKTDFINLI